MRSPELGLSLQGSPFLGVFDAREKWAHEDTMPARGGEAPPVGTPGWQGKLLRCRWTSCPRHSVLLSTNGALQGPEGVSCIKV